MNIYTRNGDNGVTRLLSGEAVDKDDIRVKAYGAIDELQSHIGVARAMIEPVSINTILSNIQQDLFVASAELASTSEKTRAGQQKISTEDVVLLEEMIDEYTAKYGLPDHFLVPGKTMESAALHVARSVCRRCERIVVTIKKKQGLFDILLAYLNRLSDFLFMLAWAMEVHTTIEEVVEKVMSLQMMKGDYS